MGPVSAATMRLDDILKPIAASLAAQRWDKRALSEHLARRLPPRLARLAPHMAKSLLAAFPGPVAPDAARISVALKTSPAARRLWSFARRTGYRPDIPLAQPHFRPVAPLDRLDLPDLATTEALADWLGLSAEQLTRFADLRALSALCPSPFAGHYRHRTTPKSDCRLRLIEEPKPLLKRLQRRLLRGLLNKVPAHDAAFGFCAGRNCTAAAARHAGEEVVLRFDLADFFPGIDFARVYAIFRTLGYPAAVARNLAGLTTAVTPPEVLRTEGLTARDALAGRHLPQGAPTSPALANLAAFRLDCRLAGLARAAGAQYSRYADDLTFSGDRRIAPLITRAVPEIVRAERFHLNPAKTRLMPRGTRQTVTGLTVNRHANIPRADYDRLKATLHHLARPEDPRRTDPAFLASLSGRIAWVEQVNPHRGLRLRLAFRALGVADA